MKHVLICLLSLVAAGAVAQSRPDTVGFNGALNNLPKFDRVLINWVGEYYFKGRAGRDSTYLQKDSLLRQLSILRRDLINYYVLKGQFASAIMTPAVLEDSSQRRVPTQTVAMRLPTLSATSMTTLPSTLTIYRTETGWVVQNQQQRDTCLTYAFSADSSLIVLSTPHKLTVKRVLDGNVLHQLVKKIANPTYRFSASNTLYVVDQLNPSKLKRIDSTGALTTLSLPDSLTRFGYRIDQILPDDTLLVYRRILKGQTLVSIWNFIRKKPQFTSTLNYIANACHIDSVGKNAWLLSAHRTDKQTYQLRLITPGQTPTDSAPIPEPIQEYQLDRRGNLVALRADSSLIRVDLTASSPTPVVIDTQARFFDWQGDTIVYWKQLTPAQPDRWGLFLHKTGSAPGGANNLPLGFWYDTDLRRDVPRISLRGRDVYFDDRSNNTTNRVSITSRLQHPD